MFFPFPGLPFIMLMASFAGQKHFSLKQPHLFFSFCFCYWPQIQEIIAKTDVKELISFVFVHEFYGSRSYIRVCNSLRVHFRVWCHMRVQFYSFACGCPVFSIPLIKKTSLSPLYILGSFVEDLLTIYMWAYFWTLGFHNFPNR